MIKPQRVAAAGFPLMRSTSMLLDFVFGNEPAARDVFSIRQEGRSRRDVSGRVAVLTADRRRLALRNVPGQAVRSDLESYTEGDAKPNGG